MSDLTRISQLLVEELIAKGGRELFKSAQFREKACRFMRDNGCPAVVDQALVWALGGLVSYGVGLGSGKIEQWLYKLIDRTPLVRHAFEKLVQIAQRCQDESELKRKLLDAMETGAPVTMDATMQSSLDVVDALFSATQFARLSEEVKAELGALRSALNDRFDGYDDVELHDPTYLRPIEGVAARLDFRSESEPFIGRDIEIDALEHFLGDKSKVVEANRVMWRAISGAGGVGKSRLALQLMRSARASGWRAGFVTLQELSRLRDRSWRPRWDTLIVVDGAGEDANLVSTFLYHCITRAIDFEFAVRMLVIERDEQTALERLTPTSGTGRMVESARHVPTIVLEELPIDAALTLMEERGRRLAMPELPADTYRMMAAGRDGPGAAQFARVNPLYALAAVERLATAMEADPSLDVSTMSWARASIFADILEEEKETRWRDPGARTGHHDNLVELHANLLWLATFAGGLEASDLPAQACGDILPGTGLKDPFAVERARYIRMAGGEPRNRFEPLKPDLLGEYFILSRLLELDEASAAALLDAAYREGRRSHQTFRNCAVEFPELWRRAGRLRINPGDPAAGSDYVESAGQALPALKALKRDQDIEALWLDVKPHLDGSMHDELPAHDMQTIIMDIDPDKARLSDDGMVIFSGYAGAIHSFSRESEDEDAARRATGDKNKTDTFYAAFGALMNFASAGNETVSFEALVRASRLMGPLGPGEAAVHLVRLAANYFNKASADISLPILRRLLTFFDPEIPRLGEALSAAARNLATAGTQETAQAVLAEIRPLLEPANNPEANRRIADIVLLAAQNDPVPSSEILEWLVPIAVRHDDIELLVAGAKLAYNLADHEAHPADDPHFEFVRYIVLHKGGRDDAMLERAWAQSELTRFPAVASRPNPKRIYDMIAVVQALGYYAIQQARDADFDGALHYRGQRLYLTRQLRQDPQQSQYIEGLESELDKTLAELGCPLD